MTVNKATSEVAHTGTAGRSASSRVSTKKAAQRLRVREEESPWTAEELAEVKGQLEDDAARLQAELDEALAELSMLMHDSGDGAGDDQADAGAKAYEREQEMTLVNNARELLAQSQHALERIADATYGICESCDNGIGKLRLQAFPRATLCMTCKQKEERH